MTGHLKPCENRPPNFSIVKSWQKCDCTFAMQTRLKNVELNEIPDRTCLNPLLLSQEHDNLATFQHFLLTQLVSCTKLAHERSLLVSSVTCHSAVSAQHQVFLVSNVQWKALRQTLALSFLSQIPHWISYSDFWALSPNFLQQNIPRGYCGNALGMLWVCPQNNPRATSVHPLELLRDYYLCTVVPRKSGHLLSPNTQVRFAVVSGYQGWTDHGGSSNNQQHQ